MERRFVLFLVLSFGILIGYSWLMQRIYPPKPRDVAAEAGCRQTGRRQGKPATRRKPPTRRSRSPSQPPKAGRRQAGRQGRREAENAAPANQGQAAEPEPPEQWVTLGSADPNDPYRMLVTLTNKGAALVRVELNSPRYCDIDDRSGYLGHLVMDSLRPGKGCPVQVVGPGTPAAEAGLKPGDIITAVGGKPVDGQESLEAVLEQDEARQEDRDRNPSRRQDD